jgi:transcriptional regulator GlxA family with amidase domain
LRESHKQRSTSKGDLMLCCWQPRAIDRREMVKSSLAVGAAATLSGIGIGSALPRRDQVRVAFILGEGANMIDTAGPWEVFQDAMLGSGSEMRHPFELYTVGKTTAPVRMTGGFSALPQFSAADAPEPNAIVVPAHGTDPELQAWIKTSSASADVTMSVCTGAFKLAALGLLDGLTATTHHDFWDRFEREFPNVKLVRGTRFIDHGRIATAGGLTSGIDMALHIVRRYFGEEVAAATATYMEHDRGGWRTGRRA